MRAITPNGTLVVIGGSAGRWINGLGRAHKPRALSPFVSQRLLPFLTEWSKQDPHVVNDLIEAGNVRPVIDRTYPLSDAPEAMRHLEAGHARGKIVVKCEATLRELAVGGVTWVSWLLLLGSLDKPIASPAVVLEERDAPPTTLAQVILHRRGRDGLAEQLLDSGVDLTHAHL